MNIIFKGKYKSINQISWSNIPAFSVITGKNGTGKSQLLDLIKAGIIKEWEDILPNPPSQLPIISDEIYRIEDLVFLRGEWVLSNLGAISLGSVQQERTKFYRDFQKRQKYLKRLNASNIQEERKKHKKNHNHTQLVDFFDDLIEDNQLYNEKTLTKEDFFDMIPNNLLTDVRLQATNSNIGKIFYNYRLDLIQAKVEGKTEEDFIKENSEKPWIQINTIFKDIDLPFELNNPEKSNIRDSYTPVLKNILTEEPINFSELSSGEKVLVSLVFWLFNSNDKGVFPKILLLDEPDAHLHPSMTKQFINIVKNILCDKYGVRVIMTTHSPSTVSIAPEESLFLMKKDGHRIEKSIKDSALGILTAGLPSFSVNYENRRQIFVESPNDVLFYERLYSKLQKHLIPEISLTFISSGESKTDKFGQKVANCGQVINICKTLRNAGNKFVWGIIDWDTDNEPDKYPFIKVLGDGDRYAIESYLFDPILVAAIVLREKLINKSEFGLTEDETYLDFKKFNNLRLQDISNKLISMVASKVKPTENLEVTSVSYVNNISINIPKWYLIHQGHELEDEIIKVFPRLGALKKGREELLKLEIIDKIIDDLSDLIPKDILIAFKFVQKK
jgi:ABC-type lipoprotein export system ATPase subunit